MKSNLACLLDDTSIIILPEKPLHMFIGIIGTGPLFRKYFNDKTIIIPDEPGFTSRSETNGLQNATS